MNTTRREILTNTKSFRLDASKGHLSYHDTMKLWGSVFNKGWRTKNNVSTQNN
ncbi:hypothetical protein [uncultured Draconibacterium sp.]|uniref:hypothetical protein n=1 Tax=uncultured Draconibacterium sp. TaxID=1573823 RepID=UPI0032175AF0